MSTHFSQIFQLFNDILKQLILDILGEELSKYVVFPLNSLIKVQITQM